MPSHRVLRSIHVACIWRPEGLARIASIQTTLTETGTPRLVRILVACRSYSTLFHCSGARVGSSVQQDLSSIVACLRCFTPASCEYRRVVLQGVLALYFVLNMINC